MPEGPECRLTVDYLIKVLQGRTIKDWIFSGGKYTDSSPEGFQEFDMALPLTVTDVSCKGKFIYFKLVNNSGNNFYIMHSLMMTGKWQKKYDDYCKWFVELDTGTTLWFSDSRGFGSLKFTTIEEVLNSKLQLLGPDIMRSEFRLPLFKDLIKKYTNRNITSFLMNQEVISGCGNYIKAEVLYYSKISPFRKTGSLDNREIELLYEALRIVSRISYNNFGISDQKVEDSSSHYSDKTLKVYGKKMSKRSKTSDGRITYWDPEIQI